MRALYAILLAAALPLTVHAQSSLLAGPLLDQPIVSTDALGGIVITQSASTDVVGGGVACAAQDQSTTPPTSYTTENSYLRVFDLSVENLPSSAFAVTSVDLGVGNARLDSVVAGFVDTEVIFHRLAPGTTYEPSFPRSALTEVGRTTFRVTAETLGLINVPVPSMPVFNDTDLMVVEWSVPNGTAPDDSTGFTDGFDIRYGYNEFGQAGPTYLSTETSCGGLEPTDVGELGPTFGVLNWVLVVNGSQTSSAEDGPAGRTVRIGDARPNPSATGARVPFSLQAASDVRVSVIDALGREVAVLAEGAFGAGDHEAIIAPGLLPAGAYLVRLTTPEASVTQRLTVAR